MAINVGILMYDDVEVLDFAGPYEVFTCATRMHAREHPVLAPLFSVFTVSGQKGVVRARAGMCTFPDFGLSDHPVIDCLVVPGGVVNLVVKKPDVVSWIQKVAANARVTASVCTGVFLLAKAGLVRHESVTTHWEDVPLLRKSFPSLDVKEGVRWVDAGRIVTSAGITAGIDMSLHLVERLHTRELALRTARQMEFEWTENA